MKIFFVSAFLLIGSFVNAQDIQAVIAAKSNAIQIKLVEWRRHLHQNPELGNREFKTADYIAKHLKSLGLDVQTNVAHTGVVAILKGSKPGPVMALRADIDALPIYERSGLPFASKDSSEYMGQKVPVMHACGHDTHTAVLMGTAEVLVAMKKEIAGTVKFIFQPAEEGAPGNEEGGAKLMVKEGVMNNPKVDVIFGMHINSLYNIGELYYKSGAFMAAADWFSIKVKGKGSHGSQPWFGIDPISISAQIIQGLQNIVSRQMELTKAPVVITVGKITGGVRENIIPETVLLQGTIRTLDSAMQQDVHRRIKQTAENIAAASNATVEVGFDTKTLVTYNTPWLAEKMVPSLQKAAGIQNVKMIDWTTGAEDFSYFGEKAPSFFFNIGGKPLNVAKEKAAPHHTADFYVDDSRLELGIKAFCQLVFDYPNLVK
jgi:amidohydrolase